MAERVKVRVEFELTRDQARTLQQIMKKERVTAGEACRLLLAYHLEKHESEAEVGIQRHLPRAVARTPTPRR